MKTHTILSLLVVGLTVAGCDKTTAFETIPYEFIDMAVAPEKPVIPSRPLADAEQYDRVGRPLVTLLLANPFGFYKDKNYADEYKDIYNGAVPMRGWTPFSPQPFIQSSLALWDGLDLTCGNQPGAAATVSDQRYKRLADILADDRLWMDTAQDNCTSFMNLEGRALGYNPPADCGGRPPQLDVVDQLYSIVVGSTAPITDGVASDVDGAPTNTFPFLQAAK